LRAIAAAAVCVCLGNLLRFQAQCVGVRRAVLRLHVIANSDSARDQEAKLFVRDQLLLAGADLFDGSIDAAQAQAAITPRIASLEACARRALRQCGLRYGVEVRVEEAYFNTRTYEEAGVTLPAGRYQAVRVILGEGAGQNWWCVMFPPLCLPAAAKRPASPVALDVLLTQGQLRVVKANPKYEIRFKLVELWEQLLERLRGR
jgi:stage II sporulation protein R